MGVSDAQFGSAPAPVAGRCRAHRADGLPCHSFHTSGSPEGQPMARPMARDGVKEKLLLLARERGYVTLEDVVRVAVDEPVDLEDLRDSLEEAGFELIDAEDDDTAKPLGVGEASASRSETEEEEVVVGAHILRAAALEAEELMPDTPA